MKRIFKAHPLMILSETAPFLFVLIIPLTRAVFQYLIRGEVQNVLGFEMFILLAIAVLSFARYKCFSLMISENKVTVKKGFLFGSVSEISIKNLSCVETRRSPLDFVFGAATVCINTEAGRRKRADFRIKMSKRDAQSLISLIYGEKEFKTLRFSDIRVALFAVSTSSAVAGLVISVPIIKNIGRLLGVGLSELFFNEIGEIPFKISAYFPPFANTLTLVFVFAYLISFVYSFAKYMSLRIFFNKEQTKVYSGFFTISETVFEKSEINALRTEQTFLMMLFKRYTLKADVGGFGTKKDNSQVIIPVGKKQEVQKIIESVFPTNADKSNTVLVKKGKTQENRFLYICTVGIVIIPMVSVLLGEKFYRFSGLILFIMLIFLILLFCYAFICKYEYKNTCFEIGKGFYANGVKRFRAKMLCCNPERIGLIKIRQIFSDKKKGTCRVKFYITSQNGQNLRLRHLCYREVKTALKKASALMYKEENSSNNNNVSRETFKGEKKK